MLCAIPLIVVCSTNGQRPPKSHAMRFSAARVGVAVVVLGQLLRHVGGGTGRRLRNGCLEFLPFLCARSEWFARVRRGPESNSRKSGMDWTTVRRGANFGAHRGAQDENENQSKSDAARCACICFTRRATGRDRKATVNIVKAPAALEAAIDESHEALRKIVNGDPSGYVALFADREDITLGNPFGPFGKGRAAVIKALNNASTKYKFGTITAVDRIAIYGDGKIMCLIETEHGRAKLGTNADFSEIAARVTSVYEKIGNRWKLVHRHADPIMTARPAESMLNK
jgi:ketosteroid isomerase-like protein